MKVLWLTNHILPEHDSSLGKEALPVGGWMPALADALTESRQVELGIATNVPGCLWTKKLINNKIYFSIPIARNINYRSLPLALIQDYQRVVNEFKPDIIHIHGTEYFHGLITGRKYIKGPTVISIQGLIDVYKKHYFGEIGFSDLVKSRTLRDWIRLDGLIEQKIKWYRRAKWEQEIFASNITFIGRTQWDRAHTRRMNPAARYYHCDELLRAPFYEADWNIDNINRHTIYASSASYPLKGFHVLLKAISLLHHEFPDIRVRIPSVGLYHTESGINRIWKNIRSGGYARYLANLIKEKGIGDHIFPLGNLDARMVVEELKKAHVFVLPSFIENSPNSLAEAMLVGTPSVTSFVGGVPSMVHDGQSALCFPPGDEAMLAEQIRQFFLNDDLLSQLSVQARDIASIRHQKEEIVRHTIEIYRSERDSFSMK